MVFKNLLRRKFRTLLTALGISIGVAAIISLGALAEGLGEGYQAMLTGSKADLVLSQPDTLDISYSTVDEKIGAQLLAMPEVAAVSGMLQSFVQTDQSPFFFIFGYPEDSFILRRFRIIAGVSLDSREARQVRGKALMIGSAAAESFKKGVGDTIRLAEQPFRIVGIYQTGEAFEDGGAVLRLADAQQLLGKSHQVSLFYIQLKDVSLREQLTRRVERLFPDLALSGTAEFADKQMIGDMMKGYVWAIAALAIVIGGVGMMNAQLAAVMERTREIGVLRSVGWHSGRILWMILGESVVMCLLGGILGTALGWLAVRALGSLISWTNAGAIGVGILSQAFITVLILGLVGGIYPAWRASRLEPVEALRYEGSSGGGKVRRLPFGGMPLQNLWQRLTRTLLTLGAVGLTVGAIMSLESIVRGAANIITDMAVGSDVEIMIRQADVADTSLSAIDSSVGAKIAALPEVESVSGIVVTAIAMPEAGGFFIILGYAPNEYAIRRYHVVSGERITSNHQIMIGRTMADALNKGPGDTLVLGNTRFRITGIYESGASWEELGGVITLRDAQTFMGRPRKVTMYAVKVRDPSRAELVVEEINRHFPEVHAALAGEFADQMPDIQNSRGMLAGISALAIIVGGVGVLNTMMMSVLERTREIGVLRAMGWRRRAVLDLILREALLLGCLGGIVGIIIAFSLTALIQLAPMVGQALKPVWEWDVFARAIVIALTLGALGGLYPAFRATRLEPVEALRYE